MNGKESRSQNSPRDIRKTLLRCSSLTCKVVAAPCCDDWGFFDAASTLLYQRRRSLWGEKHRTKLSTRCIFVRKLQPGKRLVSYAKGFIEQSIKVISSVTGVAKDRCRGGFQDDLHPWV